MCLHSTLVAHWVEGVQYRLSPYCSDLGSNPARILCCMSSSLSHSIIKHKNKS